MISQERKSNRVLHDQSESFSTGFPWEIHELLKKDRQWIDIALMGLCGSVVEDDETHEVLIGLIIQIIPSEPKRSSMARDPRRVKVTGCHPF